MLQTFYFRILKTKSTIFTLKSHFCFIFFKEKVKLKKGKTFLFIKSLSETFLTMISTEVLTEEMKLEKKVYCLQTLFKSEKTCTASER